MRMCATALNQREQYLDLLAEHEDLLQLLAQQEVVRKKLLNALKVRHEWQADRSEPPAPRSLSESICMYRGSTVDKTA